MRLAFRASWAIPPELPVYDAPQTPLALEPAPGARGAKLCGIWAIVAGITCVGLPIGIVLAIVALVKQAKANRFAREEPGIYEKPAATGLVLGILGLVLPIVMLPFIGIVSAIAIPALLSQRARARDKAAMENMVGRTGDLIGQYDKQSELGTPKDQIPAALEAYLKASTAHDTNPWNPALPAYRFQIEVVTGLDRDAMEQEARAQATNLGQPVWVIELPAPDKYSPGLTNPGFLAGAVQVQNQIQGERTVVKAVEIE